MENITISKEIRKRIINDAKTKYPITEDTTFCGIMQDAYVEGAIKEYFNGQVEILRLRIALKKKNKK